MTDTSIQICKQLGDVADTTLRFFKQIGVETVGLPARWNTKPGTNPTKRPLIPPAQTGPAGSQGAPWDEAELKRLKAQVEAFGLKPVTMGLNLSGRILLGQPGRDEDLAIIRQNIALAGQLGIEVLTYSFTALRASEGYGAQYGGGRGGADLRDFDAARIRDLPPLETVGQHSREAMWDRLVYFLEALVPTAEAAGVKLAAHPNDPPVPVYRGVAQPFSELADWQRLIEVVDSPANTLFFDSGVTTEIGEDAVAVARYFGERGRIGMVHFRNVRVLEPRYHYLETFHDDGDCDMAGVLHALQACGYDGPLDPDHTPGIDGDTSDTRIGWAFAIGQIIGWSKTRQANDDDPTA